MTLKNDAEERLSLEIRDHFKSLGHKNFTPVQVTTKRQIISRWWYASTYSCRPIALEPSFHDASLTQLSYLLSRDALLFTNARSYIYRDMFLKRLLLPNRDACRARKMPRSDASHDHKWGDYYMAGPGKTAKKSWTLEVVYRVNQMIPSFNELFDQVP